jgi:hypothetical protein
MITKALLSQNGVLPQLAAECPQVAAWAQVLLLAVDDQSKRATVQCLKAVQKSSNLWLVA